MPCPVVNIREFRVLSRLPLIDKKGQLPWQW